VSRAAAADALPFIQRTPAWVEARRDGIGASEAAAALGLSRWQSPVSLWAHKLGLVPETEQTLAMRTGTVLEPYLAELYTEATGLRIRRANRLLRSRRHPFMLASLDRRAGDRIVELKWTARGDGYGEPGTDEVPDEVLAQVIHQMAVVDAAAADVAVLVGGADFRRYTVTRDLEAEAVLVDAEREFWRHVEERTEPPVDGSLATQRALAELYPRDNGIEMVADADAAAALLALRDVRASIAVHEENERRLRAALEAAMGEAAVLVAPGVGRVTWKATKDSQVTDWKAVASDFRTLLAGTEVGASTEGLDAIEAQHTTTKTGVRRFVPRWEQEDTHGQ
jgi:putative phage-type endonuclease